MDNGREWHPSDDFIEPLRDKLIAFFSKRFPSTSSATELSNYMSQREYAKGINWLAINCGSDFAEAFNRHIERLETLALTYVREYIDLEMEHDDRKPLIEAAMIAAGVDPENIDLWSPYANGELIHVRETLDYLEQLSVEVRRRVVLDLVPHDAPFAPNEVDRDILSALTGRRLTADELEGETNYSRNTLYGGRNKTHGLPALEKIGIVKNDGKGYYRVDHPPSI